MELSIKPKDYTETATKLNFKVIDMTGADFTVYYELRTEVGKVVRSGNKVFPKKALALIAADNIDKADFDQLLHPFGIELQ